MSEQPDEKPALRIVKGEPSAEDIAVLTALMAAVPGAARNPPRERRGGWNDPSQFHRRDFLPGPNAWRAASW